jgi:glucosamine kinase
MNDIFIGIDGGATKSKVRIEDKLGNVLGQTLSGPSNMNLSVEGAWQSILHAIEEALKPTAISLQDKTHYRFHAGMGIAGCEIKSAYEEFMRYPHEFTTLQVVSDAHIACLGAHLGQDGSVIIVGTGAIGYQIEKNRTMRVGGWGFPHDDVGGGAWIGMEAIKLTLQWLDHRTEKSPLVVDIFNFFNDDLDHLVLWANRANSTEYARLAPLVINHAQQEELAAVRIMKKAAHAIDRIGATLLKIQTEKDSPLPCTLMGGIAPFIEPWIHEELRAHLVQRTADANAGAILMVREFVAHV